MMNADMHEICRRRALHFPGTDSQRTHVIKADSYVKAEGREYIYTFLGAFAKIEKSDYSLHHVCSQNNSAATGRISMKFRKLIFLENSSIKFKFD